MSSIDDKKTTLKCDKCGHETKDGMTVGFEETNYLERFCFLCFIKLIENNCGKLIEQCGVKE